MTHTQVQVKNTSTGIGVFGGSGAVASVDISAITGDWTLVLEIFGLDSGDSASFAFEDSVDAFTTPVAGPTVSVTGQIGSGGTSTSTFSNPKRYSFKKEDYPGLRFGTGSAVLRINLTRITGSSPHVTYQAYLET